MEFLGQGSGQSCSYDLSHSCSNDGPVNHCSRLGIEPVSQRSQDASELVAPQQKLQSKVFNISLMRYPLSHQWLIQKHWKTTGKWFVLGPLSKGMIVRWLSPWLVFSPWDSSLAGVHDGTFLRNISWLPQNRGKSLFWTWNMAKFLGFFGFFFWSEILSCELIFLTNFWPSSSYYRQNQSSPSTRVLLHEIEKWTGHKNFKRTLQFILRWDSWPWFELLFIIVGIREARRRVDTFFFFLGELFGHIPDYFPTISSL